MRRDRLAAHAQFRLAPGSLANYPHRAPTERPAYAQTAGFRPLPSAYP
jgi:hypothetical protein